MRKTVTTILCGSILSACTSAPVRYVAPEISTSGLVRVIEDANAQRRAFGLQPLAAGQQAERAALRAATDMALHGTFSHTGTDGSSAAERLRDAGCSRALAENIAKGKALNTGNIIQTWMESPGHRENILRPNLLWMGIAKVDDVWVMTLAERC